MSDFRRLSDNVYASPQITPADIAEASALGVTMVINNRPEGETEDQPPGPEIEAAAHAAGMEYVAIPVTMPALSDVHVTAMRESLDRAAGPVLAYCRSGTRSTVLWALAQAKAGADLEDITRAAAAAGYDVSPVRAAMEAYTAQGA
jgi:uncharacterized protein (TIGR01244 family)